MPATLNATEMAWLREFAFHADIVALRLEDAAAGYGQGRDDHLEARYLAARDAARALEAALEAVTHGDVLDPGLPGNQFPRVVDATANLAPASAPLRVVALAAALT